MANFKIDDEIKDLLPKLSEEEDSNLTANLKEHGCRDGLVLGSSPDHSGTVLIDGHNRYRICKRFRIPFKIAKTIKFKSGSELTQWIIDNQLARRNLTDERRAYYRGKEYLAMKKGHGGARRGPKDQSDDTQADDTTSSGQIVHSNDEGDRKTAKVIAAKHGVEEKTVRRDAKFTAAVDVIGEHDPKLKDEILSGRSELTRQEVVEQAESLKPSTNGKPKKKGKRPEQPEFLTHEGKYDHLVKGFSNLARAITKEINDEGGETLKKYLTMFKLVVYPNKVLDADGNHKKDSPRFRGFPGLRRVIKLASMPGRARTEEQVKKEYARKDEADED